MIRSIITYGAEIWGSGNIKFHKVYNDNGFESCFDKTAMTVWLLDILSKKISNDQELIQSDPTFCPQNQKGNN